MKRKSRTPTEKQHESCGVWLDASALKRCKLQNLIGKPTLRILNRLPSYSSPSKAPLPCTKQTTISTFFRAQQTGEKEINTNGQLLADASHLEDHEWPAGEPTLLPASLIQAVVMQECKQQTVEKLQHISPWNLAPNEAQSNSRVVSYTKGRECASQRGDPLSFNCSQHQEEKGLFEEETLPKSPLREKNGGWKKVKPNTSASQSSPNPKAVSYKGTNDWRRYNSMSFCNNTFMESTNSENIDPQQKKGIIGIRPMKKVSKTPLGFSLETNDEISDSDKYENSEDAMSPLFTQDSDGHKVISHRCFHEPSQLSFQRKLQQGKSSSGGSQSHKDGFGTCYSVERRPHISVLADISQKPCYDLLFTEDSEGNKVIKH
ncbi:aurora kinase A- and ninein-interacting protein isoform X1 [Anolis sagrei]|uniref:aurora kinase A- and ninein-interacting protein isoform X1 n=1 Tax=Anolis sagrei TaxID=38937 RepID=UPI0035202CA5